MSSADSVHITIILGLAVLGAGSLARADDTDCKVSGDDDDHCLLKKAKTLHKPDLCDNIVEDQVRATCFDDLARALNREDLCVKAEHQRVVGRCLTDLALKRQDAKPCELIRDVYEKARCLTDVAQRIRSIEVCTQIQTVRQRVDCQLELAKITKSPDTCAKIDSARNRDECYVTLVGNHGLDPSLCERIEAPGVKKSCYHFASRFDPRTCEHVGDPHSETRAACYELNVTRRRDPATCDLIQDPYMADNCLSHIGKTDEVASLCEKVHDWVLRDDCFSRIASKDPEYCFKLRSRPRRRQCAEWNWRKSKDPGLCQLLREPDRVECRVTVVSRQTQTIR